MIPATPPEAELDLPGAAAIRRRAWRETRILWGAAALGLLALAPFGSRLAAFSIACPFRSLFGLPCPTCGATRSALALARFDFVHALVHYPLPTLGWIGLIGGGLLALASVLLRIEVPEPPRRLASWQIAAIVLALLANWAYSIATGV